MFGNNVVKHIVGGLVEIVLRVESGLDVGECGKQMDDLDLELEGSTEEHVDVVLLGDDEEEI